MPTNERAASRRQLLNMLAVQIAGELPGNRADAIYVLDRVRKVLEEHVFDSPAPAAMVSDASPPGPVTAAYPYQPVGPQLSLVSTADRASS
jgi:hypothetical protein